MRIEVSLGALAPDDARVKRVHHRLRCSLGSYSAEVRRVRVAFRPTESGTECTVRIVLRGDGRQFEVTAIGRDLDTALRFVSTRASAAVVRSFENDRRRGR